MKGVDRTEATDADEGSHDCRDGASCRCNLCQHFYTIDDPEHTLSIRHLQQETVLTDAIGQTDLSERLRQRPYAHIRPVLELKMNCSEGMGPSNDLDTTGVISFRI